MSYTMEDFKRDMFKKYITEASPEERREIIKALPSEERREILKALPLAERLADSSPEEIRRYFEQRTAGRPAVARKQGRKK